MWGMEMETAFTGIGKVGKRAIWRFRKESFWKKGKYKKGDAGTGWKEIMVLCAELYWKKRKFNGKPGVKRLGTDNTENRKRNREKCLII